MTNRILDVVVVNHGLDPVETELRIHVKTAELSATTEIRGRLLGPRCVYSSTVEIAYAMREVDRADYIELRVLIPEPSWWDPETPFLYEGPLELWQDGALCERVNISHGIRWLQLTSKGLRLNGKPFVLRGRFVEGLSDAEARSLRGAGFTALWASLSETDLEIWRAADRLGFFVLGMSDEFARFLHRRNELAGHASAFGWIFNRADFSEGPCQEEDRAMLFGVNTSATGHPLNADFLFCHERELAWLGEVDLPKIVVVERLRDPLPMRADVIGWIESPTT